MKRNLRNAFNALIAIGAPVMETTRAATNDRGERIMEESFTISGEANDNRQWADYYMEYGSNMNNTFPGFHKDICDILSRFGLYPEWENAGMANVWEG